MIQYKTNNTPNRYKKMNRPLPIKPTPSSPITLCITTIAITLLLIPHHHATSQPQLDTITSGTATIQQEATTTTITQTSHSTTLNWNSYNINQGHTITYNQPSTSSIAINNIKDTNPSQILGNINANGRIILLNPNGFYIGPNSTISANTFIAAAANLQQTTYNQNTNTLTLNNPQQTLTGDITLHGTITTTNTTQLIAHHINQNTQATITATNHIALKATHTISLHATHTTTANNSSIDLFANQTITGGGSTNTTNTTITTSYLSLTGDYTATNTTSLTADTILLNHQATITSPTTTIHSTQQSLISATIQSPNTQSPNTQSPNTQGSTTITSDGTITLLNATITTPQQDITIGSTTTPPTQITINQNTIIDTSHPTNPGTIIIYATNTALHGTILANAITGTGGFIEVSGTRHLTFNPTLIQATSTYGTPGTVFIDPENIIITDNPPPTTLSLFNSFTAANPGTTISGIGRVVATTDTHVLIANQNFNAFHGNAYLYNIATETWTDLSTTPGTPITSLAVFASFGVSVALNNTYALIGAFGASSFRGNAYLYRLDGSDAFTSTCATTGTLTSPWCTLSESTDQPITSLANDSFFGDSVALNNTYALIGANGVSSSKGDAYLYRLDGSDAFTSNCATAGTPTSPLTSPWCTLSDTPDEPITSLAGSANFGRSVALNDTYALIGAFGVSSNKGEAFLYRLDGSDAFTSTCTTTGTPTSPLTSPWCTLSQSSDQPITSLPGGSNFGISVALNDTYALIGADGTSSSRGNAFLYRLDGSDAFTSNCATTDTPTSPLTSPWCTLSQSSDQPITSLAGNSNFGISVALNDTYALIGASGVSSNKGDAFLYRIDGTNAFNSSCEIVDSATTPWCAIVADAGLSLINNSLISGDSNTGSLFGSSVSLSNTTIVIGARRATGISQGNAFLILSGIIDTTTTFFTPTQVQTMLSTNNVTIMANNDITILSSITYTGTNSLTLTSMGTINANPLDLATTTTLPTITVPTLTINASGNVGSTTLPLSLISPSLTINAGTNSVFLTHPTDISTYLAATITSSSLSLTQTTGDITISSAIDFSGTNLTLNATAGAITTTLTTPAITANNLTLTAAGNIGSSTTPFILTTTGALTLTSGTPSSIFLTHPTDISTYLAATITSSSLSLIQTTGDITISSAIDFSGTNLTLIAQDGSILTTLPVSTDAIITADNLTLIASGSIGLLSSPFVLSSTTGSLSFTPGTANSVFLAHPSDISDYYSATQAIGTLHLIQTTGAINITSAINLPTTNLTLTALAGAITTTLTTPAITANNLTLTAAGNIGSSATPFILTTTGALTLTSGTASSVFLAHPTDISTYLAATITSSSLSLTQTTGDITLTATINLPTTNLTLTASAGSILTTLTATAITVADLTTTAAGNIGSSSNPIVLTTTGALTLTSGTANSVFLAHPTNPFIYRTATINSSNLSLTQTTGDITISSAIDFSGTNLTLIAQDGSILTTLPVSTDAIITADNLTLIASGSIGLLSSPFVLSSTTGSLSFTPGTANSVFLAHPSDISDYYSATQAIGTLHLIQTTGAINITSAINLSTTNLTLTALAGAITTTLTTPAITANNLSLTAAGNIGSSTTPFILTTTGALTLTSGTASSIFLTHPTDISTYLAATITSSSLSLTQTTGDINITAAINLPTTNLTLTALAGSILTTLTTTAITVADLTTTAAGNIGSSSNPIVLTTTGALTLTSGTANSVFLAHPTNPFIYRTATINSSNLSLTQTTGDITISSAIDFSGTNLTLIAQDGSILTTLSPTTATITADELILNASDTIGSVSNPLYLITTTSLTITPDSTSNTIYLSHPTDVFSYLTSTLNSNSLSLTQTTGDINITSAIDFSGTNLTLTASAGAILTTLSPTTATITADELTLTASDTIGSVSNPLYLITTTSLTITPDSTSNTIYLSHPTDISPYLSATITAGSLSLTQTTGDINITSPINEASLNLELRATGTNASINIQNNITTNSLTLFAINTITTTSSNNLITAPTINLQTMQGDIGTTTNRIYLSSGENNPPFTSLTLIALTTNSNIYIRANQNSDNTAFTAIRQQVIDNNPNPTSTYTITIFNDASQAFSQGNDLRFTIPPPRTNNDSDGFFASITDIILSIFGDDCDDDDSGFVIGIIIDDDVIQILCF